jgi:hypothetical protein
MELILENLTEAPNRCVKYKDKMVERVEKIFPDGTAQVRVTDTYLEIDLLKSGRLETGNPGISASHILFFGPDEEDE